MPEEQRLITKERLKKLRVDHSQTQNEIAKVLEVSRQQYARLESQHTDQELSFNQAIRLTQHYTCSLSYLAGFFGSENDVPYTATEILHTLKDLQEGSEKWLETMLKLSELYAPAAAQKFKEERLK
ncbi:MAG: hypothetical protein CMF71_09380 [Magnetovibrio sp.]|nr:hypothetical protein [Magnetovibrio sp.]|tara:strand:+ start:186 stop:563 length:378 start_codon:yes stop_codon:yes gene_type:complete